MPFLPFAPLEPPTGGHLGPTIREFYEHFVLINCLAPVRTQGEMSIFWID